MRQLLGKSEAEFYAAHSAQCVMGGLIHSCSFWSGVVRLYAVTGRPETASLIVRQFRESRVEINVASGAHEEPIPDN